MWYASLYEAERRGDGLEVERVTFTVSASFLCGEKGENIQKYK